MTSVLQELVEALMSDTKGVREQARELLRITTKCFPSMTLSNLLKPHLHLIDAWLPPKSRLHRLTNLPTATQIAIIVRTLSATGSLSSITPLLTVVCLVGD